MKRFFSIDFLRAAAILAVIVIHVFSDNLTNPLNTAIWNYLHFIIVAFVFCSGYVMYAFYAPKLTNALSVIFWYRKRLIRLLLPFYWYLLCHYLLMLTFPKLFSGLGLQFSWHFILQSVTLVGGINLNWLPLLFLQLAVLFPILVIVLKKARTLFWIYLCFAILTTLYFTLWQFPYALYRQIMWIPWSIFLVLPWYFYEREKKKSATPLYMLLSAGGAVCFVLLYMFCMHLGRSLTLIDNKYPPNFFYISYEVFGSFLLLALGQWSFLRQKLIAPIILFISQASYALFFIHYIVMDFTLSLNKLLGNHISVWYQTIFVVGVSLGISWLLSFIQKRIAILTHA